MTKPTIEIRPAIPSDTEIIFQFISELAEFEKLSAEVTATEAQLRQMLFGERPYAEVLIGLVDNEPKGFALFFHNFSTFKAKPGLYLEDLYVRPQSRGNGLGKALLKRLAAIAVERNCARFEWAVLNWNESAITLYKSLGARPQTEWTPYRLAGDALSDLAGVPPGGVPGTRFGSNALDS